MIEAYEKMSLAELIGLRDDLSQLLRRRFGRSLALVFTDVEGSTAYFARFGDEAGRALQQKHIELLHQCASKALGRIVDTAGDGAFACFGSVDAASTALTELQMLIGTHNLSRPPEHLLKVRSGIHWGHVLTDGQIVTGDSVNFCARVMGTGQGGEIRVTKEAFSELSSSERLKCTPLASVTMKGFADPVALMLLEWQDRSLFPTSIFVQESGETITLPQRDVITFGRLKADAMLSAEMTTNDVVLSLPDPEATLKISRWHFELRRSVHGFLMRPLSSAVTEVDGQMIMKGNETAIRVGSVIRVAGVLTLRFCGQAPASSLVSSSATVYGPVK